MLNVSGSKIKMTADLTKLENISALLVVKNRPVL